MSIVAHLRQCRSMQAHLRCDGCEAGEEHAARSCEIHCALVCLDHFHCFRFRFLLFCLVLIETLFSAPFSARAAVNSNESRRSNNGADTRLNLTTTTTSICDCMLKTTVCRNDLLSLRSIYGTSSPTNRDTGYVAQATTYLLID